MGKKESTVIELYTFSTYLNGVSISHKMMDRVLLHVDCAPKLMKLEESVC